VRAAAIDRQGLYLATAGLDCQLKVWDVRTFKPLHEYFTAAPAVSIDVSQRGMLAVGYGSRVQVWKDAMVEKQQSPYMNHRLAPGQSIRSLAFCPYEDVLGVGHSGGVSSLVIPGAGEPNFDSFVANPFITNKQRREQEVHQLLDKLPPETIMLNPDTIGGIKVSDRESAPEGCVCE
jgi:U3 small nucleolar RNA-associated protein 7